MLMLVPAIEKNRREEFMAEVKQVAEAKARLPTAKQLAVKYGYTERWVEKRISEALLTAREFVFRHSRSA